MSNTVRNPKWSRDELILALELYLKFRGKTLPDADNPDVISLSNILNKLPIHPVEFKGINFRNSNSVTMKLSNFLAIDPAYEGKGLTSIGKADKAVWNDFSNKKEELFLVASRIKGIISSKEVGLLENIGEEADEESATEGRILARTHFVRERNKKIVKKKKLSFLNKHGALFCEACGFNFEKAYGKRGQDFIECHHIQPVSQLTPEDKTTLNDLMLLCSNCHRMVHTKKPWLSPKELLSTVKQRRDS